MEKEYRVSKQAFIAVIAVIAGAVIYIISSNIISIDADKIPLWAVVIMALQVVSIIVIIYLIISLIKNPYVLKINNNILIFKTVFGEEKIDVHSFSLVRKASLNSHIAFVHSNGRFKMINGIEKFDELITELKKVNAQLEVKV